METKLTEIKDETLPKHIGIIMDGNGRWAQQRGLHRVMGHREGVKTVRKILYASQALGIKYLTVYAFSTENWKRPQSEVNALMQLFREYIKKEKKDMNKNNVRLVFSGKKEGLSPKLIEEMNSAVEFLSKNNGIVFNIAFNYGGRSEIIDAVNRIVKEGKEVNEEEFRNYLYNPAIPDPELIIRTSGEMRMSNFLTWQAAYSEFYVTDKNWPDFNNDDLKKALENYAKRDRRFGGIKNGK